MLPRDRGERNPRAGLLAIGVVLVFNGLLFLLSGSAPVLAVQGAAGQVVRTVSEPVAAAGKGIAAVRDLFVDIRSLQARLAALLDERDQLASEAARIASLEREVAELQATLDLRATTSFTTVAAQVVARDFAIDRRYVILDVGSIDGVKVGDVVIGAGASLAGRVVQVSDQSCRSDSSPTQSSRSPLRSPQPARLARCVDAPRIRSPLMMWTLSDRYS